MKENLRSKSAFSLIELSIAMSVMAVLASSIVPIAIRSAQIRAGEKTALEISMLQEAGRNFYIDNHSWPTDIPTMQAQGYLNPQWNRLNPWHNPYQISSSNLQMTVNTDVPVQWTNLVASHLSAAVVNQTNVSSTVSSPGVTGFVPGVIVAWSGTIANIPAGWALCDGTNGTPDLRDKFIIGAKDVNGLLMTTVMGAPLQTGGSTSHDHGAQTGPHTLTITEMPRHHHGYMATPWTGSRYDGHSSPLMTQQVAGQTDDTGGDQPHDHPISSDFNVPPFYALAFIMRL